MTHRGVYFSPEDLDEMDRLGESDWYKVRIDILLVFLLGIGMIAYSLGIALGAAWEYFL